MTTTMTRTATLAQALEAADDHRLTAWHGYIYAGVLDAEQVVTDHQGMFACADEDGRITLTDAGRRELNAIRSAQAVEALLGHNQLASAA